jgi:Asp/Glu/hydantoin racemase
MMSSVDTGYDIAQRCFGDEAYGFTRSVLAQHRRLGQQLQIVTFDKAMTALYESTVEATGHRAVVAGWTVVDRVPAAVAAQPSLALEELHTVCRDLARTSMHPIFVVGTVGLALTEELRRHGMEGLIDPVSDLLGWLGSA